MQCALCRYDSNSGGEREIQRTMLELLNQLDGFDSRGDVKVIMATNRIETLDPALIRPGLLPSPMFHVRCIQIDYILLYYLYESLTEHMYTLFLCFKTEMFPCVSAGRIDRKIEFPLPDEKTKRRIFQIHTSRMTVADDVTLDDLILAKDDLSGADIKVWF